MVSIVGVYADQTFLDCAEVRVVRILHWCIGVSSNEWIPANAEAYMKHMEWDPGSFSLPATPNKARHMLQGEPWSTEFPCSVLYNWAHVLHAWGRCIWSGMETNCSGRQVRTALGAFSFATGNTSMRAGPVVIPSTGCKCTGKNGRRQQLGILSIPSRLYSDRPVIPTRGGVWGQLQVFVGLVNLVLRVCLHWPVYLM